VGRPRDPAVKVRNEEIYARWYSGESVQELAVRYDRKPVVISRIIARQHPEGDEYRDRSLHRGYLQRLLSEVHDLYQHPGYKMAPTGSPAHGPDGEPAEDTNVKIQAGELELKILESLRKLDARDKVQPKIMTVQFDVARQKMAEDLAAKRAELEDLARRAVLPPTVPGEVIRELPPSNGSGGGQRQEEDGG